MKKRVTSFLMAAVMALTSVPTVGAIGSFEFMKEVQNALPAAAGTFIGDTPALPAVGGTGFLKKLSGDLPAVQKDGFLAEPTAPLKTFPGTGELLAEISAPDENAIEIDSADALAQVISGGSYVLTADIDLSEVDWESQSQSYSSPKDITLDGQGHTISGLTGSADQYSSGLFGIVYGNLTARNLILRDFSLERGPVEGMTPHAGALAAWADKGLTLENCVLDGFSLTASDTGVSLESVGGFVGELIPRSITLDNCRFEGEIDAGMECAGGLIGYVQDMSENTVLRNCLADGVIRTGGIVGSAKKTAKLGGCTMNGSVTGTLSRSHDKMKYGLTAGSLAGSVQHLHLDASEFTGVLVYSPGLGNDGRYLPLLGDGVIEGASAPEVELPEHEEEDYKVTVYGYTMQDLNGYLLEDAVITVDGKGLGQTDALGEFGFSSEDVGTNGVPHISWLENSVHADGERTDLYTMTLNTTAIDLVLEQISYDEDHLLNTGEVKLEGMVYNNSLTDAEGLQVNITDENGKTVYTNIFDRTTAAGGRSRFYAVFAPDGKSAHTYTVSVTPIVDQVTMTDADASDNTLEVGVAAGEGEIVQLGFVRTSASADVALEAFVRNTGGASADKMTVTVIDANGETVIEEVFEDVPIGSTRQVLLKNISANERYTVAVTTGSDETDRQTALYTDPDAPFLKISSMEMDRNSVELVLLGQGQTEGASRVLLALYQNGKMRYAAEDTTESLNGNSAMEFVFDEPMAKGEYGYKLFFLADGGTFAPLAAVRSGKLSVE